MWLESDRVSRSKFITALLACAIAFTGATVRLYAQERLYDKDLEKLLSNLASDAERLEKDFNKAVNASAVRHTSKEKDLQRLSKSLAEQAKTLEKNFKDKKPLKAELQQFDRTASEMQSAIREYSLTGMVDQRWEKVRGEYSLALPSLDFRRRSEPPVPWFPNGG